MSKNRVSQMARLLTSAARGACLLAPVYGCARDETPPPAPMPDRFALMDINNDGKVVIEEFRQASPDMNEQAFLIIDKNGDKAIDRAEWVALMETHGSGQPREGAPMNNIPGDPMIPSPDSADLPLVRPPAAQ